MAIIRTKRTENFTVINNDLLNDGRLDWRDLGLLVYLLSKPDNWEVSVAHLESFRNSCRHAIYASLKKLEKEGYVKKRARQSGFDYEVFDSPIIHHGENHRRENHRRENPPQVNTDISINTDYKVNTDNSTNTEVTTTRTREGSILNDVQYEIFVWASTHEYWHKATTSEEEFLKALCSAKGGMRRQFENRFKNQSGDNNATQRNNNGKQSKSPPNTRYLSDPDYYSGDVPDGFRTSF